MSPLLPGMDVMQPAPPSELETLRRLARAALEVDGHPIAKTGSLCQQDCRCGAMALRAEYRAALEAAKAVLR